MLLAFARPLAVGGLAALLAVSGFAQDKPKIAVMRFQSTSPALQGDLDQLTAELASELSAKGRFVVLPTNNVREQQQQIETELSTTDPEKVAPDLRRKTKADWVFIPYVKLEDGYSRATISVIGLATIEQHSGFRVSGSGKAKELIEEMIPKLAEQAAKDTKLLTAAGGVPVDVSIPASVKDMLEDAEEAGQDGKAEAAIAKADAARKAAPANPAVLERCAAVYETAGEMEKSLDTLREWLALPASAGHPLRSEVNARRRKMDDAIEAAKKAAEEGNRLLKECSDALARKDTDAAELAFRRLKKLAPDHMSLRTLAERLKELGCDPSVPLHVESEILRGLKFGVSTPEAVWAKFGRNCFSRGARSERFVINYLLDANGKMNDNRRPDHPGEFEFERGLLSTVDVGPSDTRVVTVKGISVTSKFSEVTRAYGHNFTKEEGIPWRDGRVDTYTYDRLGVSFRVHGECPEHPDWVGTVLSITLFAPR